MAWTTHTHSLISTCLYVCRPKYPLRIWSDLEAFVWRLWWVCCYCSGNCSGRWEQWCAEELAAILRLTSALLVFSEASNCSTMKQSTKLPRMVLCGHTEKAPSWQEQGGQRAFTVTGTSRLLTYPAKAQQKRQLLQMGIQAWQRPGRQQLRAVQLRGRQSNQQLLSCEAQVWQMQVGVDRKSVV